MSFDDYVQNLGDIEPHIEENRQKAADLIVNGMEGTISAKTVTYDFERMMENATLLKCSEFGDAIIKHMDD